MQPPPPPPPPPPPRCLHSNFFSSLKQVEKRLKLEHPSRHDALHPPSPRRNTPPFPGESSSLSAEDSLSSPMYLHLDETKDSSTLQESSEAPHVFLSCSPQFPAALQHPPQKLESNHPKSINHVHNDPVDDIQLLIQLLGLRDVDGEKTEVGRDTIDPEPEVKNAINGCRGNDCHCENEFYTKIVGVKGPKCGKEVERLDGWIKYFLNGDGGGEGERLEPLRLAYLLLGKAAFASESAGGCFEGLEFPSTVEDFLLNDPPR